ncbi:endo-1,4-beta-xylanase [Pedobacter alpinus]|uniref:Beta-xylanase n=1 Tax=Pedobacter alpinus TaxID=1590643 RepID=A0ABW5TUX7_9SPHI
MIKNKLITSFLFIGVLATSGFAQESNNSLSKMTLKEAFAGKFLIGCADDLRINNEAYQSSIKTQYDIVTPENSMKPQSVHPTEGKYNFVSTDAMVDWCEKNGLQVWGHTLAWHGQTPRWFFQEKSASIGENANVKTSFSNPTIPPPPPPTTPPTTTSNPPRSNWGGNRGGVDTSPQASKEVVLERLKNHIMTVAGRYKGRLVGWDVFNESIADGGDGKTENLRTFSWYKAVGPEVITMAFKWAHEADPKAQLYYNDYNIEQGAVENKGKHASSMLLLKRLIAEGAPISGVGIQGHWHLNTNLADVEKAIENYASLGLKVSITELDVTATGDNSGAMGVNQGDRKIPAENYQKQADVYKKLFEIFMRHSDVIDRVTFWGLSDTRSWRRGQDALLFDGDLNPKPAYKAVIEASVTK